MIKIFSDPVAFKREADLYLELVDKDVIPLCSPIGNFKLEYNLNSMRSVKSVLKGKKMYYWINELLSFAHTLQQKNIVHGALTLDNLFVGRDGKIYAVNWHPTTSSCFQSDKTSLYKSLYAALGEKGKAYLRTRK